MSWNTREKTLKDGDIINIDVTVIKNEYHGDTSKMFIVGTPSVKAKHVVQIAHECLYIGIDMVKPGVQLGDIGHAIQQHAEKIVALWCAITADMELVVYFMRIHKCFTMEFPEQG